MARPAKWNSPTVSIRVPEHAVDRLLNLAKVLDAEIALPESDQQFEEYVRFVQNLQSHSFSVRDMHESEARHYLIRGEFLSFEQYKLACRARDEIKAVIEDLTQDEYLYLLSCLVEENCELLKLPRLEDEQ